MSTARMFLALILFTAACGDRSPDAAPGGTTAATEATGDSAFATLRDVGGRELGVVTLREGNGTIAVSGTLRGVAPGEHGFHLHAVGTCTPTFDSAGGHWNPTARQHGRDNAQGPHYGDLTNVVVGADSTVAINDRTPGGTLRGDAGLLDADGAAVMLHANPDDYRSDPAGDAGARIACGVIAIRKP